MEFDEERERRKGRGVDVERVEFDEEERGGRRRGVDVERAEFDGEEGQEEEEGGVVDEDVEMMEVESEGIEEEGRECDVPVVGFNEDRKLFDLMRETDEDGR